MDCIFKVGDRVREPEFGHEATVMAVKKHRIKVRWDFDGPDHDWKRNRFHSALCFESAATSQPSRRGINKPKVFKVDDRVLVKDFEVGERVRETKHGLLATIMKKEGNRIEVMWDVDVDNGPDSDLEVNSVFHPVSLFERATPAPEPVQASIVSESEEAILLEFEEDGAVWHDIIFKS